MTTFAAEVSAWLPLVAVAGVLAVMLGLDRERVFALLTQVLLVVATVSVLLWIAGRMWTDPQLEMDPSQPALPSHIENSFPSDHAALPLSLTLIAAAVRRRTGAVFGVAVLLGSTARLAAGSDRWPDVVSGWVIAVMSTIGVLVVWDRMPDSWVARVTGVSRRAHRTPARDR